MSQADFQASNPYASFGYIAADAPAAERLAFIKRTYLHLALAIYVLVTLEFIYFKVFGEAMNNFMPSLLSPGWYFLMFGGFVVSGWVARSWANSDTSVGKQYAGLAVGVFGWSVMLAPLLWIANHFVTPIGSQTFSPIAVAGVITLLVFAGLTAVVFLTRTDFSFLAPALSIATMVAMGLILASYFFGGLTSGMWFSAALVLLASGYILYDTSNILHHYRTTQHVAAALALFGSVAALLFWYILRIVLAFSNRD